VLGALPQALARLGHEVKVCLPRYGTMDPGTRQLRPLDWTTTISFEGRQVRAGAESYRDARTGPEYFFIRDDHYFNRSELYRNPRTGKDYADNDERFAYFNRATLELVRHLEFRPDIIHVHDWQAALIPAYLKTVYARDPILGGVRTVLTVHNLGYQGTFASERFPLLGLPEEYNYAVTGPFEFFGKLNFLKAGIVLADAVTTVSPRYAAEIRSSAEFGRGLEGVLKERSEVLHGILNGVDLTIWSPSRDKKIPHRYGISNLSGKRMTRVELLGRAQLPVRDRTPLIGMISRLADQKGWDLIADTAERLFAMDLQMIVLGTGDEKYHRLLAKLEQKYPDKLKAYLRFDDTLAHWIEAGADMFLMPSRYEPCGLNQMYSLRYGTVPVVRAVGGLADTVADYDPKTGEGTGFVFRDYSAEAFLEAVRRALTLFTGRRVWMKLMKAGMRQDFSWQRSAVKYAELFEEVISRGPANRAVP